MELLVAVIAGKSRPRGNSAVGEPPKLLEIRRSKMNCQSDAYLRPCNSLTAHGPNAKKIRHSINAFSTSTGVASCVLVEGPKEHLPSELLQRHRVSNCLQPGGCASAVGGKPRNIQETIPQEDKQRKQMKKLTHQAAHQPSMAKA